MYFHFYGMTLVALLTDLIFKRFGIQIIDEDTDPFKNLNLKKSKLQLKNKLFESLLESIEPHERPKSLNYSTFRYSPEREKRWGEMYTYFVKFMTTIL